MFGQIKTWFTVNCISNVETFNKIKNKTMSYVCLSLSVHLASLRSYITMGGTRQSDDILLPSSCDTDTQTPTVTRVSIKQLHSPEKHPLHQLTINNTALSNCSAILSATFTAHGVGLKETQQEDHQTHTSKKSFVTCM